MPNLTSRHHVATSFHSLAIDVLYLGLFLGIASSANAQRGGRGGGMAQGTRGMAGHAGGRMDRGRGDMRDGSFDRPMSQLRPELHSGLQLGLSGRWWDDHKTIRKLNLRPDQQHRMDDIFEANKPTLITLYSNLQREETHLALLSPADLQDESKVFAAIDRVSHARSDLEKENVHMLLQIRQQLDPKQLQTLDREIASLH